MNDDKKEEVKKILEQAGKKKNNGGEITVSGDHNIVGNGNSMVVTERYVVKQKAEPKPGEKHITEQQVRRLHDLKDEIIRLEQIAKRNPATHQRVWAAFNKAMGIGSMRMLPIDKFSKGEAYLLAWIGRLNNTASVESKDYEESKKRKLTYIRVNMRKLPIEEKVKNYMRTNFGVESTKNLPDLEAIKKVYSYVASLKKALSAK